MITYDKIIYNQTNWRDDAAGKDKNVARGDFVPVAQTDDEYQYRVSRAIKYLRQFNDKYNDGKSEILDRFSVGEKATHMHHIFPETSVSGDCRVPGEFDCIDEWSASAKGAS